MAFWVTFVEVVGSLTEGNCSTLVYVAAAEVGAYRITEYELLGVSWAMAGADCVE